MINDRMFTGSVPLPPAASQPSGVFQSISRSDNDETAQNPAENDSMADRSAPLAVQGMTTTSQTIDSKNDHKEKKKLIF